MMNVLQTLEAEVVRFQGWAVTVPVAERYGEWECDYPGPWPQVWKAFTDFVTATSCSQWDAATIQMLLYIVARDNEMGVLIGELAKNPAQLLFLAEQAVIWAEEDARWQMAAALGRLEVQLPQIEPLLLQFAHDEDEYTRRCALLALAKIGSVHIEALVESAWATGDEHARIAVLHVLYTTNSPQLNHYLRQAEADDRKYLTAYVARLFLAKRLAVMDYQATLGPLQQAAVDAGVDLTIARQLPSYLDPLDPTWTAFRVAKLLTSAGFPRNPSPRERVADEIWRIYQLIMSNFLISQEVRDPFRHQGGKDPDGK